MTTTVKNKDGDDTALMLHQSILAKLLSKENIKIRHGNYTTAFFELKTRTLGLPRWANKGKDVYDLLIGHEVGHALYTPQEAIELFKKAVPNTPFDVCNIVEDIRIERLIQDTYPGLVTVFRKAYASLIVEDFFGTAKTDISTMKFIDRLNLHAKAGPALNVPFSAEELAIYDRCFKAQTFAEVLEICKDIKDLATNDKKPQQEELKSTLPPGIDSEESDETPTNPGEADVDVGDAAENESQDESADSQDSAETPSDLPNEIQTETGKTENFSESPLVSKTLESYEKALENIAQIDMSTSIFTEPSAGRIRGRIIPYMTIMGARAKMEELFEPALLIDSVKSKRRTAGKYSSNLVREFERRKAAFQYSRATVARRGVINVDRLHAYKTCDDIFSTTMKLADAKSHGMMMFVDYSGSMDNNLGATLEHLVNLVLFCRAIKIPFNVYGFTSFTSPLSQSVKMGGPIEEFEICLDSMILLELFSSKMNKSEFDLAVNQVLAQAVLMTPGFREPVVSHPPTSMERHSVQPLAKPVAFQHAPRHVSNPANIAFQLRRPNAPSYSKLFSKYEALNDTPLVEVVVAAHTLVAEFRKATNVQKMNVIFLTDGGGSRNINFGPARRTICAPFSKMTGVLNGKVITFGSQYEHAYMLGVDKTYALLIKHLRATTGATVIGFFIPGSAKAASVAANKSMTLSDSYNHNSYSPPLVLKRGEDFYIVKDGYNFNEYYILPPTNSWKMRGSDVSSYEQFVQWPVLEDETQNKKAVTKLFLDLNLQKKSSQKILNKFSQMIA